MCSIELLASESRGAALSAPTKHCSRFAYALDLYVIERIARTSGGAALSAPTKNCARFAAMSLVILRDRLMYVIKRLASKTRGAASSAPTKNCSRLALVRDNFSLKRSIVSGMIIWQMLYVVRTYWVFTIWSRC